MAHWAATHSPDCGRPAHSYTSPDLQTGRRWAPHPSMPCSPTSRDKAWISPKHLNVQIICFITHQQSRKSQDSGASGGRAQRSTAFKYCVTDLLPAIKLKQVQHLFCSFYLYAGLKICGSISQHNMGFDWLIFSLWLQGSVKTVNLLESPAGLRWL